MFQDLGSGYITAWLLDTLEIMSKSFHERFICDIWASQLNHFHSHSHYGLLLHDILNWIHMIFTYINWIHLVCQGPTKPWLFTANKSLHSFPNTQNTDLCFHYTFYLFWIWKLGFLPFQFFPVIFFNPHPLSFICPKLSASNQNLLPFSTFQLWVFLKQKKKI